MERLKTFIIISALFLIAAAPEAVYVQSIKAKILESPSFNSSKVADAEKGDKLNVLEESNRWYKVSINGKSGWIPSMLVGVKPPLDKVSVFTGEERDISANARRRASAVTTAAAARGLTEDDRRRLGNKGDLSDYDTLEKVEAMRVSDRDLQNFLRQRD